MSKETSEAARENAIIFPSIARSTIATILKNRFEASKAKSRLEATADLMDFNNTAKFTITLEDGSTATFRGIREVETYIASYLKTKNEHSSNQQLQMRAREEIFNLANIIVTEEEQKDPELDHSTIHPIINEEVLADIYANSNGEKFVAHSYGKQEAKEIRNQLGSITSKASKFGDTGFIGNIIDSAKESLEEKSEETKQHALEIAKDTAKSTLRATGGALSTLVIPKAIEKKIKHTAELEVRRKETISLDEITEEETKEEPKLTRKQLANAYREGFRNANDALGRLNGSRARKTTGRLSMITGRALSLIPIISIGGKILVGAGKKEIAIADDRENIFTIATMKLVREQLEKLEVPLNRLEEIVDLCHTAKTIFTRNYQGASDLFIDPRSPNGADARRKHEVINFAELLTMSVTKLYKNRVIGSGNTEISTLADDALSLVVSQFPEQEQIVTTRSGSISKSVNLDNLTSNIVVPGATIAGHNRNVCQALINLDDMLATSSKEELEAHLDEFARSQASISYTKLTKAQKKLQTLQERYEALKLKTNILKQTAIEQGIYTPKPGEEIFEEMKSSEAKEDTQDLTSSTAREYNRLVTSLLEESKEHVQSRIDEEKEELEEKLEEELDEASSKLPSEFHTAARTLKKLANKDVTIQDKETMSRTQRARASMQSRRKSPESLVMGRSLARRSWAKICKGASWVLGDIAGGEILSRYAKSRASTTGSREIVYSNTAKKVIDETPGLDRESRAMAYNLALTAKEKFESRFTNGADLFKRKKDSKSERIGKRHEIANLAAMAARAAAYISSNPESFSIEDESILADEVLTLALSHIEEEPETIRTRNGDSIKTINFDNFTSTTYRSDLYHSTTPAYLGLIDYLEDQKSDPAAVKERVEELSTNQASLHAQLVNLAEKESERLLVKIGAMEEKAKSITGTITRTYHGEEKQGSQAIEPRRRSSILRGKVKEEIDAFKDHAQELATEYKDKAVDRVKATAYGIADGLLPKTIMKQGRDLLDRVTGKDVITPPGSSFATKAKARMKSMFAPKTIRRPSKHSRVKKFGLKLAKWGMQVAGAFGAGPLVKDPIARLEEKITGAKDRHDEFSQTVDQVVRDQIAKRHKANSPEETEEIKEIAEAAKTLFIAKYQNAEKLFKLKQSDPEERIGRHSEVINCAELFATNAVFLYKERKNHLAELRAENIDQAIDIDALADDVLSLSLHNISASFEEDMIEVSRSKTDDTTTRSINLDCFASNTYKYDPDNNIGRSTSPALLAAHDLTDTHTGRYVEVMDMVEEISTSHASQIDERSNTLLRNLDLITARQDEVESHLDESLRILGVRTSTIGIAQEALEQQPAISDNIEEIQAEIPTNPRASTLNISIKAPRHVWLSDDAIEAASTASSTALSIASSKKETLYGTPEPEQQSKFQTAWKKVKSWFRKSNTSSVSPDAITVYEAPLTHKQVQELWQDPARIVRPGTAASAASTVADWDEDMRQESPTKMIPSWTPAMNLSARNTEPQIHAF